MSIGVRVEMIKRKLFRKRYEKEHKIEVRTINSFNWLLIGMVDNGYAEFFNPKTGENISIEEAMDLYKEQLATELKGS